MLSKEKRAWRISSGHVTSGGIKLGGNAFSDFTIWIWIMYETIIFNGKQGT